MPGELDDERKITRRPVKFRFSCCIIIPLLFLFVITVRDAVSLQFIIMNFAKKKRKGKCERVDFSRKLCRKSGCDAICKIQPRAQRKYLTNFAPRFPHNRAGGIPCRSAIFLQAARADIKERCCNRFSHPSPSHPQGSRDSVFVAENCNFPRREGMRLSVDGFLNANNSGETVITGDNRSLSLFLPFTSVPPSSRDTARALFYKPRMGIERVGVSISRRLLIHDYRLPRYSLPECKMAASPDRRFVA